MVPSIYQCLFGREATTQDAARFAELSEAGGALCGVQWLSSSPEHVLRCLSAAPLLHLHLIHAARVKLVSTMLPPADMIVDLGGANGNIYDLGYRHPFTEVTVVDLPPALRCEMYRSLKMEARQVGSGRIRVLYSDMTDMGTIRGGSIGMVWMGQAIEHITEQDSFRLYREVLRVLRNGGHFCLDTPNRNITAIHTVEAGGGWIHPEHKVEYSPSHLRNNLESAGFRIQNQLGICEMVRTWQSKRFDYTDFVTGAGLSSSVDSSYIQYYDCVKP